MSNFNELIERARSVDPGLARDLENEVRDLNSQRKFGLVFERHMPESVNLPGRKVRRGSKVRMLPPRGETTRVDQRVWTVKNLDGDTATLRFLGTDKQVEETEWPVEDLVAVAEFSDTIYPGLVPDGEVNGGDVDDPAHVVINADISTGWDCPRAEVLVSLRPAKDQTHITQTIGRMVRSPLARRIEGNGLLNSTWCLLPRFDEETTTAVAGRISKGKFGGGGTLLPTVLIDAIPLGRNPEVENDKALWRALSAVPTYAVPRTIRDDIRRLNELSLLLSQHGIVEGCVSQADDFMTRAIRAAAHMYEDKVEDAKRDIETASLRDVTAVVGGDVDATTAEYTMVADDRSIQQSQKQAERGLSGRQLKKYINSLIDDPKNPMDTYDATLQGVAAGWVDEVVERVRMDAATRVKTLLTETRTARKALSDEKRSHYERVITSGAEPLTTDFVLPSKIMVQREQERGADGEPLRNKYVYTAPTYMGHVIADKEGLFPVELNTWEQHVLDTEQAHDKHLYWYRNPSRAGSSSVVVPYLYEDEWRAMCPDFIFFTKRGDDVEMNIVDPHGAHLGDALAKLQGLARYAERHGGAFGRIEAVAEIDGTYRVLDMQQEVVRNAVKNANSAVSVYSSDVATDYS